MCASQNLPAQVVEATLRNLPTYTKVRLSTEDTADLAPRELTYRGPAADGRYWFTGTVEWFVSPDEVRYLEVVS